MAEPTQVQTAEIPAPTAGEIETAQPAEPTAPVSTTSPVEAPTDDASKVGGVVGYLLEKEKALKGNTPAPPVQTAPEVPVEVPPVEEPVIETPPAPAAPEVPVETPPTPEPEDKKPDRIRVGALPDGHLVAAATTIAREEKIPFADAFARVSKKDDSPPASPSDGLRARSVVESEIAAADAERDAAAEAGDKLEAGSQTRLNTAQKKFEALTKELAGIDQAEQRAEQDRQTAEQADFTRQVNESKGKAAEYWPDAGVDNSDFTKRMIELADQYESDPRLKHHVFEADAPFYFAELVAKEIGILPVHLQKKQPTATPAATPAIIQPPTPPTKPAPVNQRAVARPVQPAAAPASGAARTSTEVPKVDFGIDNIHSVADYEKAKKKLLAGAR